MKINGDVSACVLEQRIIFLLPIRNPHATPVTFYHIHTSRILTLQLKLYLFLRPAEKKKKSGLLTSMFYFDKQLEFVLAW